MFTDEHCNTGSGKSRVFQSIIEVMKKQNNEKGTKEDV